MNRKKTTPEPIRTVPAFVRVMMRHKNALRRLPDESAGALLKALLEYAETGAANVEAFPEPARIAFEFLRPDLDDDARLTELRRKAAAARWEKEKRYGR